MIYCEPNAMFIANHFSCVLCRYDEELALADAREREVKMRGGQKGRSKLKVPSWK